MIGANQRSDDVRLTQLSDRVKVKVKVTTPTAQMDIWLAIYQAYSDLLSSTGRDCLCL